MSMITKIFSPYHLVFAALILLPWALAVFIIPETAQQGMLRRLRALLRMALLFAAFSFALTKAQFQSLIPGSFRPISSLSRTEIELAQLLLLPYRYHFELAVMLTGIHSCILNKKSTVLYALLATGLLLTPVCFFFPGLYHPGMFVISYLYICVIFFATISYSRKSFPFWLFLAAVVVYRIRVLF